ncbi:MAG TPA: tetratricopeptide repeat protein [Aggregatilinea sp.]|jgi:tetratricopeptide (TPR) repeat protein|uniref:tetratricopeptide repeat protein n=1 Tax=Aggregatilinea sp. TaxID=2806333 RepID=UPI002C109839|nr:tetratricopeptide repeat protein [Aggregatilinea sp.]HML20772.1 tetratricopeptide repeat protein [Aggregatilinea sp.]
MYLRTPKRYRADRKKRHLRLLPRRLLLLIVLILLVYFGGSQALLHADTIRDFVFPRVENAVNHVATQVSPRPTPTATPDVAQAQQGCVTSEWQGNLQEATINCQILADSNPNDALLQYKVARMKLIASASTGVGISEAIDYANRAINADPEAPYGWAIRAMVLDWQGDVGRALASALHARAIDENFAPTYAIMGEIYYDLGKTDEASTYLDQAQELDSTGLASVEIYRNRALLSSSVGDYDTAIHDLRAALEMAPNHSYIAVELANNYIANDDFDSAMSVLSDTLNRNPNDPYLLWRMGWALVEAGTPDRSYEYYRRCLDAAPDNLRCLSYLGGLQFADQDYVSAVPNLSRAVELGSEDTSDFYQLGLSYALQGQCDLGVNYLQRGYELAVLQEKESAQNDFASASQEYCNQALVTSAVAVTAEPTEVETFATATPTPSP